MSWPILFLAFAVGAFILQVLSAGLAWWRTRPAAIARVRTGRPAISVVRPVCGLDFQARQTLASTFVLDYPDYEILFCVADRADPVVPLVQELIAAHPGRPARLLVGRDRISGNPKLNNMVKGWTEARNDWIVFVDSNVLMPRDYLDRLLASWRRDTGLVSAPPIGTELDGFWSELEAAFLNTYQAKIQYAVDALGHGFAQGKTLFLRRSDFAAQGGVRALASDPAEDAAATKLVRRLGWRVRLAAPPFPQPIGPRSAVQVWRRQLRWARLRRATFPHLFLPEIFAGALPPSIALAVASSALGWGAGPAAVYVLAWYGVEAALARGARWPLSPLSPIAWMLRDALLPVLWAGGWAGRTFEWRGHAMSAQASRDRAPAAQAGS
jgi:ceramide glucosyltransferase